MLDSPISLISNLKQSSELTFDNFIDIVQKLESEYPDLYQRIQNNAKNVYGVSFIVPVR